MGGEVVKVRIDTDGVYVSSWRKLDDDYLDHVTALAIAMFQKRLEGVVRHNQSMSGAVNALKDLRDIERGK